MSNPSFSREDVSFMESLASLYDELVTADYAVYHEFHLAPFLEEEAQRSTSRRLLDLGCGTGVASLAAAQCGFSVHGVDHTPAVVEIAREKGRAAHLNNIEFSVEDVASLPFENGEFDGVLCQQMLHHLQRIQPCLHELERVLKPGGFFYIADVCRDRSPVGRVLSVLRTRRIRRNVGLTSRSEDTSDPPVRAGETPVSAAELRACLEALQLKFSVEHMTHLGLRRFLASRGRMMVIRAVSLPWKGTAGDMIFVTGKKPDPSNTES